MIDERFGRYFWLSEFVRSDIAVRRGLDNTPAAAELANLRQVLAPGMERVRDALAAPVLITSGYRSAEVNAAVGSKDTSQHRHGLAADFIAPQFGTPRQVAKHLLEHGNVRFDQLIFEGNWVHVSFVPGKPRGEVLTAHFNAGRVSYTQGLA
jgi:hypothetical protein